MAHKETKEESFFDQLMKFLTGPKKALDSAANPTGVPATGDAMAVTGSAAEARKAIDRAMEAKKQQDALDLLKKPKKDPLADALAMPRKK